MIGGRLVAWLGVAQLLCWGVSYYLVGVLGDAIAAELGWSKTLVYSGFSGALVVMGLSSGLVGRLIDRHGGRLVMAAGSALIALGCLGLAATRGIVAYDLSWACLGLAMRMTLYEAVFAALARIGGESARSAMAQVTLAGGLASTVFWPLGHQLAVMFGWRGALVCYAAVALATVPIHLGIPRVPAPSRPEPSDTATPPASARRSGDALAPALYALLMVLGAFLNAAMSAHMIGLLAAMGVGAGTAVWLSSLRGIGQSVGRLAQVLFGGGLSPAGLAILSAALLPLAFVFGLAAGRSLAAGILFCFVYGLGNGLFTIVRGTLPLVLFDRRDYGRKAGRLLAPGFIVSAAAPFVYASLMEAAGSRAAMAASLAIALLILAGTLVLGRRLRDG